MWDLGLKFRLGFGVEGLGLGIWNWELRSKVRSSGFGVWSMGFGGWGRRSRLWGLRFGVYGIRFFLGLEVWGIWDSVWVLGLRNRETDATPSPACDTLERGVYEAWGQLDQDEFASG